MIRVLYFARLRERVGIGSEELDAVGLPDLAAVIERLQKRGGVWAEAFYGEQRLMMALNQELARPETPVSDGDEVAFFPPVTGG
jgi:molybdopterin synthase sulfur carrier subunit